MKRLSVEISKPMARMGKLAFLCAASTVACFSTLPATEAEDKVIRIAVQGERAPHTHGEHFIEFDEPQVDGQGNVAFHASFEGDGFGVFLKQNKERLELIAKTGERISGVGTLSLNAGDFDGPKINNKGTVLFVVRNITNGNTTAAVFQKRIDHHLKAILKEGDRVPGTENGVFVTFDDMDQNNHSDVAIIATYTEDGGATFKAGVFLIEHHDGRVKAVLLNGDSLPHTGGAIFTGTNGDSIDGPWLNDERVVVFQVDDLSNDIYSGSVFAKEPHERIRAFVIIGDELPHSFGFGGGVINSIELSRPAFNNLNQIGFKLERDNGTPDIFIAIKELGGRITSLVPNGTPAPGTTGLFEDFSAPTINNQGFLQFSADVVGDIFNDRGIFIWNPLKREVQPLVLRGDPKPQGGAWSFELEEGSISDRFVVFLDETEGAPRGIFRAALPTDQK